jgi:23S rRNA (guanosine2251-2'-O)-methyltransferase
VSREPIIGVHPVFEALAGGERPIERILVSRGAISARVRRILEMAAERAIPVRREDRQRLDRASGGRPHQGVVALAESGVATVSLESLLKAGAGAAPPLYVVLDGVQDPQNLGSVIRTAETAGATGVLMTERRSAPLSAAVSRASAGAVEYVPLVRVGNLVSALKLLKENGVWVVGVDPAGEAAWTRFDYTSPVALVLGGEHRGIRRLVRETCDQVVRIPMRGRIESLNISVSAGILLYEVLRQRMMASSGPDPRVR